jgi:polyisoprenoid-binding protein YceI
MNNKLSITSLILVIVPFFFGCGMPAKEENKTNASTSSISLHVENEKYVVVDTSQSVVRWKGSNSFGPHTGYVYISKGELMIVNGQLTGGKVEVDMNTIEDENHDHSSTNGLITHLKDPDFFDVKKFPFTIIEITRVTSINAGEKQITGNLTIKGITHPVSFPAKIEVADGIVKANGKLTIDRTKWNVRYGSGKFLDNLKNEVIADEIEFDIKIVAN